MNLLVVTKDAPTAQAVVSALQAENGAVQTRVCGDLPDLAGQLELEPAPAALVDIDPHPSRMLSDLESIISRFSDTRFIVMSHNADHELLLETMRIGARYFLRKNSIAAELRPLLNRLAVRSARGPEKRGAVYTLLSAGGGCGVTTLAINLANELGRLNERATLLVDLDEHYGAAATGLGLEGRYGVADVLARNSAGDVQLINSIATVYSPHVHVLLSPAAVAGTDASPATLQWDALPQTLEACRSAYGAVVIDAPRVSINVAAELARLSERTVIVFQLTIKDIRRARIMADALAARGVADDGCRLVANRVRKGHRMVPLAEAQHALGRSIYACIRNDFSRAAASFNDGQPLESAFARCDLRRDIQALAAILQGNHQGARAA